MLGVAQDTRGIALSLLWIYIVIYILIFVSLVKGNQPFSIPKNTSTLWLIYHHLQIFFGFQKHARKMTSSIQEPSILPRQSALVFANPGLQVTLPFLRIVNRFSQPLVHTHFAQLFFSAFHLPATALFYSRLIFIFIFDSIRCARGPTRINNAMPTSSHTPPHPFRSCNFLHLFVA